MDRERVDERTAVDGVAPHSDPGRGRSPEWVAAGIFALLTALFYAPILVGQRAFPEGDFVHHFFPFSLYQHQQLAAGHLAIWNPYTYGGHPFLADVQAAVFYPISNFISLLTLPVTDPAARFYLLHVEAVVQTALAGWFTFLWTRDLTGSRWGGIVGGIAFAFSGYLTGYAPLQLAVLRTAIWLPLLLWTLGRAWQTPNQWRWWLGSLTALCAAFLAGHSQSFLFLGYAAGAWLLWLAWAHHSTNFRAAIGTGVIGLAAVGVTAAQWMPSVEFVRYSVRASVDYDFVSGGLVVDDFWQLLLPRVLTQYSPLYIGVVGSVLAVIALSSLLRPTQPPTVAYAPLLPWKSGIFFCLTLALFSLLAALGSNGPLYPLLYRIAPGWAWFRGQERAAMLVAIALSGLAAYGMAALPQLSPPARRRGGYIAGAIVVAAVYAFGLLWQLAGRTAVDHTGYLIIAGMTLLLGLATALIIVMPEWSNRRSAWLVALTVVNLVWANAGTNQVPGSPAERVLVAPEVNALIEAIDATPNAINSLPGRVYNEYRVYDDYGMRAEIEDVWGSSPLRVARYAALFEEFPLDRMWRLLGVEHVLTWRRELFGPSVLLAEFPQATDTTFVHRVPTANPRAWVVTQVSVADDQMAWTLLADHQFDLGQHALLGLEESDFTPVESTVPVSATVQLTRRTLESYDVLVRSDGDGLLVVSETWLPGWEVVDTLCDGVSCALQDGVGRTFFVPMRADLTLLGIWLPAGVSNFTLQYNPMSVRIGLWISGVTLLFLLAVIGTRRLWQVARK